MPPPHHSTMAASGSGDIAHLYLLELGPDLAHEEVEYITYDDATLQLLVVKGGHVFAYDVSKGPAGDSSLKWMYPLQEGPPVIALRPSLDNRMLAVQRSAAMLELVDLTSGMCFVHSIHKGRGDILTFFFTDAPETDVVVVTSRAVELNQFAARRQGLRCRERVRCSNAWALYTHETRMVLIGSALAPHSALAAWQFASHGITQLPLFELQGPLPASAAMRQFLPGQQPPYQQQQQQHSHAAAAVAHAGLPTSVPAPAVAAESGRATATATPQQQQQQPQRPVTDGSGSAHRNMTPDRLWLLKMYGRVYLAHADVLTSRLELYRFYTDTIILQHVYELFSPRVQLSVVDNALVVHHPDTAVGMLFDVALPQSTQLANPLPLRKLQLLPPVLAAAVSIDQSGDAATAAASVEQPQQQQYVGNSNGSQLAGSISRMGSRALVATGSGSSSMFAAAAYSTAAPAAAAAAGDVYESSEAHHAASWRYFAPGAILDVAIKSIYRLQLDLQAVIDSAEDWPALVGFLLRRHALPAATPFAVEPRALLVQVVRNVLTERLPLNVVRLVFDRLLQAYADALARTAASTGQGSSSSAYAAAAAATAATAVPTAGAGSLLLGVPAVTVLTPIELARELFQWVHDEEVVDALYLQAAVSEYCAASDAVGVAPPAYLQLLSVDLLLQQEQHYQAVQLLYSQPGIGSSQLAQHLLELASRKDGSAAAAAGVLTASLARSQQQYEDPAGTANGTAGGVAGVLGRSSVYDTSPGSAMALELAMDVLLRQAVPELRPVGSTTSSTNTAGGVAAMASHSGAKASTAALIRQLLSMGEVLQAARLARTAGGVAAVGVPAGVFMEVAAATGDVGAFAAVYRVMRPHLIGLWPSFEAAKSHFWAGRDRASQQGSAIEGYDRPTTVA